MANLSRRRFLLGRQPAQAAPIRPPGSLDDFADRCTGCGDCAAACDEKIVVLGGDLTPKLNFQGSGCTFCGDCATACTTGAISVNGAKQLPQRALITQRCPVQTGVYCQSCGDACPERAIRFEWTSVGLPKPSVDTLSCSGCGFCVSACPANAISVKQPPENRNP